MVIAAQKDGNSCCYLEIYHVSQLHETPSRVMNQHFSESGSLNYLLCNRSLNRTSTQYLVLECEGRVHMDY